ncbi:MAG: 3'(2'),5'-bisphosphate nucleotidase CysQ [Cellvibrionaceae bacterium]|nr:3'(2'),5'-bisphosphate nucleotidase CysQ [Cellvibrionaceae bacterium]
MLQSVLETAEKAGKKIMQIYNTEDFGIEIKSDNSPLTIADKAAHEILVEGLTALNAGPVLSEEDADISWETRKKWSQYWLVDPLDGTKEFIKRNGEFTVNVALIRDGAPVMGAVYAPALNLWYYGDKNGAYKKSENTAAVKIFPASLPQLGDPWRVVGSRSHTSEAFDEFMANFPEAELVSIGSSLKLCMVAEGTADLYPRLIPTCEWDTAAGQAVLEAAGGQVLHWETKQPLRYNTKDNLLNPYFVCCAAISPVWYDRM